MWTSELGKNINEDIGSNERAGIGSKETAAMSCDKFTSHMFCTHVLG